MTSDADEDALTWVGDEAERRKAQSKKKAEPDTAKSERPPTSALVLITYGLLGGAYLIYAIGWVISVQRSAVTLPSLFADLMFRLGEALAIGSPVIWFAAVFLITRDRPTVTRLLWLLVGLVAVIPWPFVLGV